MKVSDALIAVLETITEQSFSVTGGGAMHLNDAVGRSQIISTLYMHNEQSCSMAAEGYFRASSKIALCVVTSGPGVLNALNGVFGSFTDSVPVIILSGQARSDTVRPRGSKIRQIGDQELDTESIVSPIVKNFRSLKTLTEAVKFINEEANSFFRSAVSDRFGPVWLEVPVDIQGMSSDDIDLTKIELKISDSFQNSDIEEISDKILQQLLKARRPLILAGTGVHRSSTQEYLLRISESLQIPVATAWQHDVFPNDNYLYAGRPGTIGTRAGNFSLQTCDYLLVLGSRLNLRQISFNWKSFAKNASIDWVDIDENEFNKHQIKASNYYKVDLKSLLPVLSVKSEKNENLILENTWAQYIKNLKDLEPKYEDYDLKDSRVNPYRAIFKIFENIPSNAVIACSDASACIIPFQVGRLKRNQIMFSNSGAASMGYGLPAGIGALASGANFVVIFEGDGSIMMNLQDLDSLRKFRGKFKLIIVENGGYLSIRQTQQNFFGQEFGSSINSGLTMPDFAKVVSAFGLEVSIVETEEKLKSVEDIFKNKLIDVVILKATYHQEFSPRIKSRMDNGVISTPELDDMWPFMSSFDLGEVRKNGLESYILRSD